MIVFISLSKVILLSHESYAMKMKKNGREKGDVSRIHHTVTGGQIAIGEACDGRLLVKQLC